MAKKKEKTAEEIFAEERERYLKDVEERLAFVNEPTYFFNVGDEVQLGALKKSVVIEVLHGGKVYVLDCIATERNYGKPYEYRTCRVEPWTEIRPLGYGDTNFAKNQDVKLPFFNSTIESQLSRCRNFGVDMNPDYQRGFVWDDADRESLIESIFSNIDIGKFVFIKRGFVSLDTPYYEILDGKQRLNTLLGFYENRFPYKGKYFNDLSARDRDVFLNHHVSVAECNGDDKKHVLNYFLMLNKGGRPMDKAQLAKVEKMLENA